MLEILPAEPDDLDAVMAIENLSFACPKSRLLIESELGQNASRFYAAKLGGNIVGFIVFWVVADEIQLIDIAVHPDGRRQKIGSKLFQFMIDYGRRHDLKTVYLEVRPSNKEAMGFYGSFGFKDAGVRKGYYPDGEDAVLMKLCIPS
ncbi:MAG: ribosomal protein S18-alanine N-acetyltransferase [Deltaproteobacteria bacterium]|nr:ribosomal protein S18-alanine N-acetyltransferase [Deltaproteobacteria bacterium]